MADSEPSEPSEPSFEQRSQDPFMTQLTQDAESTQAASYGDDNDAVNAHETDVIATLIVTKMTKNKLKRKPKPKTRGTTASSSTSSSSAAATEVAAAATATEAKEEEDDDDDATVQPHHRPEYKIHDDGTDITVGRSRNSVYVIPDIKVSSHHCRLFVKDIGGGGGGPEDRRVFLEDTGSINGTFVNCVKLRPRQPYLLSHNDEISLSGVDGHNVAARKRAVARFLFQSPRLGAFASSPLFSQVTRGDRPSSSTSSMERSTAGSSVAGGDSLSLIHI